MRLPTPLLRKNPKAHKNQFGHVLILAGSRDMLGAAALASLAAMRTGAGLVTIGAPKSLILVLQKKISPVIMTLSLPETPTGSLALSAYPAIAKTFPKFSVIALGPGLSLHPSTQKLVKKIITHSPVPLVIDADALNALAGKADILKKSTTLKILTPHVGEMARLTGLAKEQIESKRENSAGEFSRQHHCVLLLKGQRTVIASPMGKTAINSTGNAGLATAGSGDVLTGMIAALVSQGIDGFHATQLGAYLHGLAADLAVKKIPKASLIATDIIDFIPAALKKSGAA